MNKQMKTGLGFFLFFLFLLFSGCSKSNLGNEPYENKLDARCFEEAKGKGHCDAIYFGYKFDGEKCIFESVGGCSGNIPFDTLNECAKLCEFTDIKLINSLIEGSPKPISIDCKVDSDCVLVNSTYGCWLHHAINKRHTVAEWKHFNEKETQEEQRLGIGYDCMFPSGVASAVCNNNKCEVVYN